MSERGSSLYSRLSHPHAGDPRVDPEARKPKVKQVGESTFVAKQRRKLKTVTENLSFFDASTDDIAKDKSQNSDSIEGKKTKERKKRIHPYNVPQGTATWSGPYGKDGTMRLEDVSTDVVAYPVYKKAYSGALTVMMEVDSPPELKGTRFQVAKPIKGTGWYR
jgi:hypothetical protein